MKFNYEQKIHPLRFKKNTYNSSKWEMTNLPSKTCIFIPIVVHLQLFQGLNSREPEEGKKRKDK